MTAAWFEWAVASRPAPGELVCGDRHLVREEDGLLVAAVVDGLGHGPPAAEAAEAAVQTLGAPGETGVRALLEELHRQLGRTRGAAISLARLERSGALSWAGVGNVEAVAVSPDGQARRLSTGNGIVGQRMGTLYPQQLTLEPETTLLWVTDGVDADFLEDFRPLLPTASIPGKILERHALGSDDALVLALRYRPGGTAR